MHSRHHLDSMVREYIVATLHKRDMVIPSKTNTCFVHRFNFMKDHAFKLPNHEHPTFTNRHYCNHIHWRSCESHGIIGEGYALNKQHCTRKQNEYAKQLKHSFCAPKINRLQGRKLHVGWACATNACWEENHVDDLVFTLDMMISLHVCLTLYQNYMHTRLHFSLNFVIFKGSAWAMLQDTLPILV